MYKWFQAHHGLMHADPLLTLSYVFNSFHRIMKPHTHTQGSRDFGRSFGWLDSWTPPWVTDWMPLTHAGWSGFLWGWVGKLVWHSARKNIHFLLFIWGSKCWFTFFTGFGNKTFLRHFHTLCSSMSGGKERKKGKEWMLHEYLLVVLSRILVLVHVWDQWHPMQSSIRGRINDVAHRHPWTPITIARTLFCSTPTLSYVAKTI